MTRLLVFALAALFIVGFGYFTLYAIAEQGLTVGAVLSILILVMIAIGVVGALRNPPR